MNQETNTVTTEKHEVNIGGKPIDELTVFKQSV